MLQEQRGVQLVGDEDRLMSAVARLRSGADDQALEGFALHPKDAHQDPGRAIVGNDGRRR